MYSAKICYRYHPRYGTTVQLVRYLRRGSAAVVVVRLPDGSQLAIPEWMLKPEACEELKVEGKPRISLGALLDVCKLIGAQASAVADNSHTCAESGAGGRDAQQGWPATIEIGITWLTFVRWRKRYLSTLMASMIRAR